MGHPFWSLLQHDVLEFFQQAILFVSIQFSVCHTCSFWRFDKLYKERWCKKINTVMQLFKIVI